MVWGVLTYFFQLYHNQIIASSHLKFCTLTNVHAVFLDYLSCMTMNVMSSHLQEMGSKS